MAVKLIVKTFSDRSFEVTSEIVPVEQTPVDTPTTGAFLRLGDVFIYIVHDDLELGYARTLTEKIIIAMTNEIYVPRRWYFRQDVGEWRVDRYSKISFWPEELSTEWYQYFFSEMTAKQHELINTRSFGWRDTGFIVAMIKQFVAKLFNRTLWGFRPDGVSIYNFLLISGSVLKKIGTWREYTLFACQDTNEPLEYSDYESNPTHWFKQGVCGHNAEKQSYYGKVNPNIGDLFIPTACPGGVAALLTKQTREVKVPISTILDGTMPVTFVELCFRNSEVLGMTEDGKWYYILQQVSRNGNQADFVLHIPKEDWPPVLPVSRVYWKKV
jgi:hypothetical protein